MLCENFKFLYLLFYGITKTFCTEIINVRKVSMITFKNRQKKNKNFNQNILNGNKIQL